MAYESLHYITTSMWRVLILRAWVRIFVCGWWLAFFQPCDWFQNSDQPSTSARSCRQLRFTYRS